MLPFKLNSNDHHLVPFSPLHPSVQSLIDVHIYTVPISFFLWLHTANIKAVDALRAQCRARRLSGKPGLGLHTAYQHSPSPFTDLQVNPSSPPPIHPSSFPELGVWLHGNLCFGAHHVLLVRVGQ